MRVKLFLVFAIYVMIYVMLGLIVFNLFFVKNIFSIMLLNVLLVIYVCSFSGILVLLEEVSK